MPSLAFIEEKNSQLYFVEYFPETDSELRRSVPKRDVRLSYKSHNPLSRGMWDENNGANPIYSENGIDASNIQNKNESLIIRDANSQTDFCKIDFTIVPFNRWMHCIQNFGGNIESVYNWLKEQIENS